MAETKYTARKSNGGNVSREQVAMRKQLRVTDGHTDEESDLSEEEYENVKKLKQSKKKPRKTETTQ